MPRFIVVVFALVLSSSVFAAEESCETILKPQAKNHPERIDRKNALAAIAPFKAYFDAISKKLFEREYVLDVAKLALLSEEHVLLMGPPGNAKSLLADTILGNMRSIGGDRSYYRIQMTSETTQSETHGPLDFKVLSETGKYVRILEEGMLRSRNVFIDEIFDSRSNALRNILGMLNERAHAQGTHIIKGDIETVFAATNRYISEVYERAGDDGPKAVIDRFAFSAFVPGEFMATDSYVTLIQGAKTKENPIPTLTFDDIEKLRALVPQVKIPNHVAHFLALLSTRMKAETEALEQSSLKIYKEKLRNGEDPGIPYRSTKYHSPRTLAKAAAALKAIVVSDWIEKGGRRHLVADLDDIPRLEKFFTLNGPSEEFIQTTIESTSNAHERAQLSAILQEREIFKKHYADIMKEANDVMIQFALHDLDAEMMVATTQADKDKIAEKILAFMMTLESEAVNTGFHSAGSGRDVGLKIVRTAYSEMLSDLLGAKGDQLLAEIQRRHAEKKAAEEARLKAEAEEAARIEREKQAAIAAEKARKEAEKAKMQAFVDSLKGSQRAEIHTKTVTLNPLNIRYAEDKVNKRILFADAQNEAYWLVSYANPKRIVSTPVKVTLWAELGQAAPDSVHFVDKKTVLFIAASGQKAYRVNVETGNKEEILLTTDLSSRATYVEATKSIYVIGNTGLGIHKIGRSGVIRKTISYENILNAQSSFTSYVVQGRQVGLVYPSTDGKHLVFTDTYGHFQWTIQTSDAKVVGFESLFGANYNLARSAGPTSYYGSQIIVLDSDNPIPKFKLVQASGMDLSRGTSRIGDSQFRFVTQSNGIYLWNSETNRMETLQYEQTIPEARQWYVPVDLGDGLISAFVLRNDSTYALKIIQNK